MTNFVSPMARQGSLTRWQEGGIALLYLKKEVVDVTFHIQAIAIKEPTCDK